MMRVPVVPESRLDVLLERRMVMARVRVQSWLLKIMVIKTKLEED